MIAYTVTYEHRDYLGGIRTEIDSIWLSKSRAVARRREINDDPADHGKVADIEEYQLRDFALAVPVQSRSRAGSRTKLAAEQVIEIRTRYADGESTKSLGRAYGVTFQTISDVCNRQTWRSV